MALSLRVFEVETAEELLERERLAVDLTASIQDRT
ncbi:hypothetical protein DES52_11641 [Deinococcus yavapaiensis KR-236]|uniref:Uncharacterized protein n=1 Tax=Deinococcus yavapaiensis KR-236 TaxID=694435 RepID=A0A318S2B9_9DEIO|nr:hypothetical protein DES52_11641 [Deinococcus yavapaiensis KR-236]